jgi:hypothetical protein
MEKPGLLPGSLHFQVAQVSTRFAQFYSFGYLFQLQVLYQLDGGYPIALMEIA